MSAADVRGFAADARSGGGRGGGRGGRGAGRGAGARREDVVRKTTGLVRAVTQPGDLTDDMLLDALRSAVTKPTHFQDQLRAAGDTSIDEMDLSALDRQLPGVNDAEKARLREVMAYLRVKRKPEETTRAAQAAREFARSRALWERLRDRRGGKGFLASMGVYRLAWRSIENAKKWRRPKLSDGELERLFQGTKLACPKASEGGDDGVALIDGAEVDRLIAAYQEWDDSEVHTDRWEHPAVSEWKDMHRDGVDLTHGRVAFSAAMQSAHLAQFVKDEIADRALDEGESPADLAREYKIREERARAIINHRRLERAYTEHGMADCVNNEMAVEFEEWINFGQGTYRGGNDHHVAATRDPTYILAPEDVAAYPERASLLGASMPDVVPGMEPAGAETISVDDEQSAYEAAMSVAEFIEDSEMNIDSVVEFIQREAQQRRAKAEREKAKMLAAEAADGDEGEASTDATAAEGEGNDGETPAAPRKRKPGKSIIATLIGENADDVRVVVAEPNGFTREPTVKEAARERRRRVNRPRRRQML